MNALEKLTYENIKVIRLATKLTEATLLAIAKKSDLAEENPTDEDTSSVQYVTAMYLREHTSTYRRPNQEQGAYTYV